jgi:hypothetical protein
LSEECVLKRNEDVKESSGGLKGDGPQVSRIMYYSRFVFLQCDSKVGPKMSNLVESLGKACELIMFSPRFD